MTGATVAPCSKCKKRTYVAPLHDERGGPLFCPICAGKWQAEHARRRKWGRIATKAMSMYVRECGKWADLDHLKLGVSSLGLAFDVFQYGNADLVGGENPDLTEELLAETLQLTHPDKHPPERRELAERVTKQLINLKPFVFPERKPEPVKRYGQSNGSAKVTQDNFKLLSRPSYPCELCADTVPFYYCSSCKTEFEKRAREKQDQINEKQREWYRRRRTWRRRSVDCASCGVQFTPLRKGTKFCSSACRQRSHRQRVTDKKNAHVHLQKSRNAGGDS